MSSSIFFTLVEEIHWLAEIILDDAWILIVLAVVLDQFQSFFEQFIILLILQPCQHINFMNFFLQGLRYYIFVPQSLQILLEVAVNWATLLKYL